MKRQLILVLASSVCLLLISCSSMMSKLNSGVKSDAEKFVSGGKYKVTQASTRKQVDTGQGTDEAPCTCIQTFWLRVQPITGASSNSQVLCLSKNHEQLVDYAALRQGDVVSFEISDNMLDTECNGSPSTFLKVKK